VSVIHSTSTRLRSRFIGQALWRKGQRGPQEVQATFRNAIGRISSVVQAAGCPSRFEVLSRYSFCRRVIDDESSEFRVRYEIPSSLAERMNEVAPLRAIERTAIDLARFHAPSHDARM